MNPHCMRYPLLFGHLVKRYKRFLADIRLADGTIITAHCPNPGRLNDIMPGVAVVLTDRGIHPQRKLRYTWEWAQQEQTWVGINTHEANEIVDYYLNKNLLACVPQALASQGTYQREVAYDTNSRIDFMYRSGEKNYFIEVKSVHMKRGESAVFPDCPTARGVKHLKALSNIMTTNPKDSAQAVVLYLVQRDDCEDFQIAKDLDPDYARAAAEAAQCGVTFLCYAVRLIPHSYPELLRPLPIRN